jgi:hypothetical protein
MHKVAGSILDSAFFSDKKCVFELDGDYRKLRISEKVRTSQMSIDSIWSKYSSISTWFLV